MKACRKNKYNIDIKIETNPEIEFDDYNEFMKRRVIIKNKDLKIERKSLTTGQKRSILMLICLDSYFIMYL